MGEDKRAVGVFDSGIGGFTIVKRIKEQLPNERIIYFGDTKRLPYGTKDKECIIKSSRQIVNFLISKDVKAIVIACNSISAVSLDVLTKEFDIPLIDVIDPGTYDATSSTKNNKVGVIATEATIKSGVYEKKIKNINPNIEVYSKACTLFVPLVEEGWINNQVSDLISRIYLQEILNKGIDTLILGCTHYPLLYECIRNVVGENITIVDPANATSRKAKEQLAKRGLLNISKGKEIADEFYVSGDTTKFNKLCDMITGYKCNAVNVDIEKGS